VREDTMWFWQVIYRDENGDEYAIRSSCGFDGMGEAFLAYQAVQHKLGAAVKDVGGVVIVSEGIVYNPKFPPAIRDVPI
jgi:hypothetical protein